jgi:hypothetical protein
MRRKYIPKRMQGHGTGDYSDGHKDCFHDHSHRLLELKEIMDLDSKDDVQFSLKIFASAFWILSMEFPVDVTSDILLACEDNVRHGHKLVLADIMPRADA